MLNAAYLPDRGDPDPPDSTHSDHLETYNLDSNRWRARFSGRFYHRGGKTRMGPTEHFGPLRVQRPYHPEVEDCLHFYLLHPPGGLVGGDRLSIELDLLANANVLMTTPSAGKVYRNISPHPQVQESRLTLGDNAVLEYLPQENIIFNGAKAHLSTCVQLHKSALFVGWEITCLGLYENKAPFNGGELTQLIQLHRDGKPIFIERFLLSEPHNVMSSMAGLQGFSVYGTFLISADVMANAELANRLICWQESLEQSGVRVAITQKPGVCIVRALGNKAEKVRQAFQSIWAELRPHLLNRDACAPRIWNT